jgi:hypothetical protein
MADNAFDQANLAFDQANSANILAQAAFNKANTNPASGSNGWIQFNDGGFLGANAGLTYNKSTETLYVKNLDIGDDLTIVNNIITSGDLIPTELGQNIGDPNSRWYNLYMDGGIYASGTFGNPGQILSSDGYGVLKWTDPPNANVDGNVVVYAIDPTARQLANDATILAQAAFNQANTGGGGGGEAGIDQYARNTANTAYNSTLYLQLVNNAQNTSITNLQTFSQAAFNQANTGNSSAAAFDKANAAFLLAQAAYNQANTATNNAASASLYANTGINNAASASSYANTGINNAASASLYANTGITLAQAAYDFANTISGGTAQDGWARIQANAAFLQANTALSSAALASLYGITGINNANSASQYANTGITIAGNAFNKANDANVLAQAAFDRANTGITDSTDQWARSAANSASLYANNGITLAQAAYNQGNSIAIIANNALMNTNSIVTARDLTVSNNLFVTNTIVSGSGSGGNISGANNISSNTMSLLGTNISISTTTGALTVAGGVGISGNLYSEMIYSEDYRGIIDAGVF